MSLFINDGSWLAVKHEMSMQLQKKLKDGTLSHEGRQHAIGLLSELGITYKEETSNANIPHTS